MDEKTQENSAGQTTQESKTGEAVQGKDNSSDRIFTEEKRPNMIDEAKEVNRKKEELLIREEKLQERKEKFEAERMVGGQTQAGQQEKPQISEAEKASREKIKTIGNATGAKWAKDMEKEDGA